MSQRAKSFGIGLYRAGLAAGVGFLVWMQGQFVTRDKFEDYKSSVDEYRRSVERHAAELNAATRDRLERIERKIDRL